MKRDRIFGNPPPELAHIHEALNILRNRAGYYYRGYLYEEGKYLFTVDKVEVELDRQELLKEAALYDNAALQDHGLLYESDLLIPIDTDD